MKILQKQTSTPFIVFIALEILIIIVSVLLEGWTMEALHITTRFSGRLSLIFFSLFLISRDKPALEKYVSQNPFLLFAIVHGIHLVELLWYVRSSGNPLIPIRLAGGMLAYAMIFAMPLFQAKLRVSLLKSRIESVYFVYVWFIFFMSYLPRVMGKLPNVGGSYPEFVILFIWVIALGLYKVFSLRKAVPVKSHTY